MSSLHIFEKRLDTLTQFVQIIQVGDCVPEFFISFPYLILIDHPKQAKVWSQIYNFSESVELVKKMIDQVAALHPGIKWFHVGADEVNDRFFSFFFFCFPRRELKQSYTKMKASRFVTGT